MEYMFTKNSWEMSSSGLFDKDMVIKMEKNEKARLLRIRKHKQQKNPSFARFESWRYKKLSKSGWRKQRGIDNKTRRKTKTGVKSPKVGYRGPKDIRGLHPSGLEDVRIMHIHELDPLDPEIHGIRVASRLGARKRVELIDIARERGFKVLNVGISKEDLTDLDELDLEDEEDFEEEDDEFEDDDDEDLEDDDEMEEEDS